MIVKGRFSLDTNILIYAVDRDAGARHDRSRVLVGRAAEVDCILTVQALAEFFHATTRKGIVDAAKAGAFVQVWLELFEVVSPDGTALVDAIDAVAEHRLSFWDAMLWATARQAGCAAILSEDNQDGRRLSGVEFINPFVQGADDRVAVLLGR